MNQTTLCVILAAVFLLGSAFGQDTNSTDCPCQDGICSTSSGGEVTCICNQYSTGVNCETAINECDDNPCSDPNSECVDIDLGYSCPCKTNFVEGADGMCHEILLWQDFTTGAVGKVSGTIPLSVSKGFEYPLPFFDFSTTELQISSRGYVQLGLHHDDQSRDFNRFIKSQWPPWPFVIAPYWTDLAFEWEAEESMLYFSKASRVNAPTTQSSLLDYARQVVRDGGGPDFDPLAACSTTWANMIYIGTGANTTERVTAQLTLATDFQVSYAIVVWHDVFSRTDLSDGPAVASGHSNPEGGFVALSPAARTRGVVPLFSSGAPTDQPMTCSEMKASALSTGGDWSTLIPCPCSEAAIEQDFRFAHDDAGSTSERNCYDAYFEVENLKQHCCYNTYGISINKDPNGPIPIESVSRSDGESTQQQARDFCCQLNPVLCAQYYSDFSDCSTSPSVKIASGGGTGSVYISNFDAMAYSFNGWGEYTLLKAGGIELQGRTERRGTENTTFFTAFAIRTARERASYQVYLNNGGQFGTVWTSGDQDPSGLIELSPAAISAADEVIVKTPAVHLSVEKMTHGDVTSLTATVHLPATSDVSEGLFGEMMASDGGSAMDPEQWRVLNTTYSLFDYTKPTPTDFDTVNVHDDYEPLVLPSNLTDVLALFTDEAEKTAAQTLCDTHVFCLLEYYVFGDDSNGAATSALAWGRQLEETRAMLGLAAPVFVTKTYEDLDFKPGDITAGFSFDLAVEGSSSNISFDLEGSMAGIYFYLEGSSVMLNATSLTSLRGLTFPQSLTFLATDSTTNLTTGYSPYIFLCLCEEDVQCLYGGPDYLDKDGEYHGNVIQIGCECDSTSTNWPHIQGRYCERSLDVCTNCYNETACNGSLSYNYCSACPAYTDGDGYMCRDIDECATSNGGCQQTCENTDTGAVCSCRDGYETNGTYCQDINECRKDPNKCEASKYCTNTEGSYTCTCYGNGVGDNCVHAPYTYVGSLILAPSDTQTWSVISASDNTELKNSIVNALTSKLTDQSTGIGGANDVFVKVIGFNQLQTRTRRSTDQEAEVEAEFAIQSINQLNETELAAAIEGDPSCTTNCDYGGVLVYSSPTIQTEDLCSNAAINTCDTHTSTCHDVDSVVYCECLSGFERTADENTCKDINECETATHNCPDGAECTNLMGSYSCSCSDQHYWDSASETCMDDACKSSPCTEDFECNLIDGGASYLCSPIDGRSYGDGDDDDWKIATIVVSVVLGFLCLCLLIAVIVLVVKKRKTLEMDSYSNSRYNDLASGNPRQQGYNKRGSNTEMTEQGRNIYDHPNRNGEYTRAYANDGYNNDRL